MDLFINNEKTMFELENEKNVFELIFGLSEILSKAEPKQFITKIILDEKEYSFADEDKLKDFLLNNLKKVEIETSDIYGVTIISLEQINNFLKLLEEIFINNQEKELISGLNEYVVWMKKGVNQIVKLFFNKENELEDEIKFYGKCDALSVLITNINKKDTRENALVIVDELKKYLDNIKNILIAAFKLPDKEYIFQSLKNLVENIEEIIPKLEKVTLLFQSGDDKESMNIVKSLTEILEKGINLFVLFKETFKLNMDNYVVKESDFETFFKSVTEHLKQLMSAIENKDSVMIGDLLEYEFIPNLGEIKSILLKIEEDTFNKIN